MKLLFVTPNLSGNLGEINTLAGSESKDLNLKLGPAGNLTGNALKIHVFQPRACARNPLFRKGVLYHIPLDIPQSETSCRLSDITPRIIRDIIAGTKIVFEVPETIYPYS